VVDDQLGPCRLFVHCDSCGTTYAAKRVISWQVERYISGKAMDIRELTKVKRQLKRKEDKFLASLPEGKREELERQVELDVPSFLRDREERILKAYKDRHKES